MKSATRILFQKSSFAKKIVLCVIFLCLYMPVSASVFDPLLKILVPIYQKVTGKQAKDQSDDLLQKDTTSDINQDISQDDSQDDNKPNLAQTDQQPNPNQPTTAQNLDLTNQDKLDFLYQSDKEPSLYQILQAEFAYNRQDIPLALQLYKGESFAKNSTAVFERALALSMQYENPQNSLVFAKAWQKTHDEHIPAWFYVTHLALKSGDYQTASQTIKKILDYDPKTDLSGVFSGIFPDSPNEQRRLFDALMALDNNNASLSALKAGLLVQLNETAAAILHINTALKLDPNNLAFYTLKANILKNTNRFDELYAFLSSAQKTTTGTAQKELALFEIRTLIDQGNLKDAWQRLSVATKHYDDDGDLLLLASLVALDLQKYKNANQLLHKLSNFTHLKSQANYYLGLSHERNHDYANALHYYKQVDNIDQKMDAVRKVVGFYLIDDKADEAIDELVALRKNYEMFASESYLLQADILVHQNQKQQAIELLTNAFNDYPDDTNLLFSATSLLDDNTDYAQKLHNINKLANLEDNPLYKLEQARLVLLKQPNNSTALALAQNFRQDNNADIRTKARVLLADKALQDKNYQSVIDELDELYNLSPSLDAGSRLLRAYDGLQNKSMVDMLLIDLSVRFGKDSQFDTALHDY